MKSLRRALIAPVVLALVLAVALVATSCSAVDPVALKVNGRELSRQDFDDELQAWYDATAAAVGPDKVQELKGAGDGSWSTTYTAFLLNDQLTSQLLQDAVTRRGLTVTDADRATARTTAEGRFAGSAGQSYFSTLPQRYQDSLIEGLAAQRVLLPQLVAEATTDEALRKVFEASGDQFAGDQACARHILILAGPPPTQTAGPPTAPTTPSDAEYAAALARIQQISADVTPENFAQIATDASDDGSASKGGDLGCAPVGTYVPTFDDAIWSAPIGQITGPVKTEYGYHLILVRSRGPVAFEDVKEKLAASVARTPQALFEAELGRVADAANISLDQRYGELDQATGQIKAPAGAQPPPTGGTGQPGTQPGLPPQ